MTIPDKEEADTMYIQLRSNTTPVYEFFCIYPVVSGPVYYVSNRPAIVWNGSTAVNSFSNSTFTVYPNPASDYIHIESEIQFNSLEMYNLIGQHIGIFNFEANRSVPISTLLPGTYMLRMEDSSENKYYSIFTKR
jgi:hypothetical protein